MNSYKNILLIRAGFRQKNTIAHPLHIPPSLSLKYTQEILKREGTYNSTIIDFLIKDYSEQEILQCIQEKSIHLVLIDINSSAYNQAVTLCEQLKKECDLLIIGAGSDVSERPGVYLQKNSIFDLIVRGEYEEEAVNLINKLNKSDNLSEITKEYQEFKSMETFIIEDLNTLPQLTWSQQESQDYIYRYPLRMCKKIRSGYVSTSRGCKHRCTFCSPSVRKSYGHKLRLRNPKKVVDEIAYLVTQGINIISFEDDDFTGSPAHVKGVCEEILKRNIKVNWVCHARIDEVSEDMLKMMRTAGCILILFGIESGSSKILKVLHKTEKNINWKEKAHLSLKTARSVGIAACAMFLVGNVDETKEDIDESIQLAISLKPDFIKVHNFTLYPGSLDYKKYSSLSASVPVSHHYQEPIFNVSQLDMKTLKNIQITFYKKFLFRFSFICGHLQKYFLFYLFNSDWSIQLFKEVILYLLISKNKNIPINDRKKRGDIS